MPDFLNIDFPYATTLAAALGAFALGLIWYHPKVMGTRWMQLRGKTEAEMKAKMLPFLATLLLWLLSSCFFSFFVQFLDVGSPPELISLACLLWVAFAMPPTVMGALYTGANFELVGIDMSYQLAGYYVFAITHILLNVLPTGPM